MFETYHRKHVAFLTGNVLAGSYNVQITSGHGHIHLPYETSLQSGMEKICASHNINIMKKFGTLRYNFKLILPYSKRSCKPLDLTLFSNTKYHNLPVSNTAVPQTSSLAYDELFRY